MSQDLLQGAPGAGGDNANTATLPYFHVYDPNSGQWTRLPDLPPTGSPNCADGFGVFPAAPDASQNITRDDVSGLPHVWPLPSYNNNIQYGYGGLVAMPPDSYFAGAYNPGGRRAFGMATLNGKIWVAGGITGADPDLVDNSGRRFTPCHPASLDISSGTPPGTVPYYGTNSSTSPMHAGYSPPRALLQH